MNDSENFSIVTVENNAFESVKHGNLTPCKDVAYPKQIFSHLTTDGASNQRNKKKCHNLGPIRVSK